jgi:hypothetical protein
MSGTVQWLVLTLLVVNMIFVEALRRFVTARLDQIEGKLDAIFKIRRGQIRTRPKFPGSNALVTVCATLRG